jgi:hypothetical protein
MALSRKWLFAAAAGTALLAGCATDPYYNGYGYNDPAYGYPGYRYGNPGYGYYVAPPTVEFGLTYSDRDRYYDRDRREWHRDRHDHPRNDGR